MEFNIPEDAAEYYLRSGENITALVHNTVIEIKRIESKQFQSVRFYGGEEAKNDKAWLDFNKKVLQLVTVGHTGIRGMYGHYFLNS